MSRAFQALSKYIKATPSSLVLDYKHSHGSWIVDINGKERLDCYAQFASQPIGWNHPKLLERADRLYATSLHNPANSDCYTQEYCDFVEKIASIAPDFSHFFFVAGGTLGVENALKAAFDWKARRLGLTERDLQRMDVFHFMHAFHGRSGYTLSLTNTHDPNKYKLFPKFDWSRFPSPAIGLDVEAIEKSVITKMEDLMGRQAIVGNPENGVAAIVIEPIQGEGGDRHFRPEFFKELRRIADQHNAMLILDEVQTGVGMTGKMWAYEHYGIVPDMICFGKKTQVCGFASTKRIDSVLDNVFNAESRLCSTWGGNLTDMVRSTIYLEIIEEDHLVENAQVVGDYLQSKISEVGVDNLRGKGLMVAFDLPSTAERDAFLKRLDDKMLALKSGDRSVRLRPHLTFSKQDADLAVDFIKKVLP
jgi:L-lysine 6-transaminase